ncbi:MULTISPECIES: M20/M25/M40 family metallo-hydrolase [Nostoc]|uniref:M20/M25/M40 family metallo-hydrolase n=2 Tax=Nostoc TaxID=1177 RepID=A0ABR8IKX5_9NOSO|nr:MULTISPECIES: M20/M25/M40 family metallo-hydrolase [Nostoc]MBD2564832.1 M20/M25/M40 family metallo-hydrolase [Nostoc linckia FACHB-391]MBD2651461.1 M20/M25/M40 family metallo-hydrolase [Nostoc foliaceum FACHB-393]
MNRNTIEAIFFDIGNTLGAPRVSPTGKLLALVVYTYVPDVLRQLHDDGKRLGVISNIGNDTAENLERILEQSGILAFFEPNLLIYGSKDSSEIFRLAATQAELRATPDRCLFVGEDSKERSYAIEAGWRVAPHPRLASAILSGHHLRYLEITVPPEQSNQEWQSVLRDLPIVPIHITSTRGTKVYAIASMITALSLDDLGFEVKRLGDLDLPLQTEMYLMRDDRQIRTGFLVPEGQSASFFSNEEESTWVLSSTQEGLYVALPAGKSIDQYHFEEAYHGHNLKLISNMSLLEPLRVEVTKQPADLLSEPGTELSLSTQDLEKFSSLTLETIRRYLARYSRIEAIDPQRDTKIKSRHIDSDGNAVATKALVRDFEDIGAGDFQVYLHQFDHPSQPSKLCNIVAEWQGERGNDEGIVIVSAHLDSTANREVNYDPDTDPAPGADDDGSGIAGVLAIAQAFKELSQSNRPKRTIRFVLFNAEEQGLIGSLEYARDEAQASSPIVAVYQLDMIGYRGEHHHVPRPFEIHVGSRVCPDAERRSLKLAQQIQQLVKQVSPNLKTPEIYQTPDVGDTRSDHASFQQVGYAACLVSEDLFLGPPLHPVSKINNPNYHTARDLQVDFEYTADIARLVAAAAWMTAKQ